ncbi:hypothetical protein DSAG12_03056 [Promethearchaeum syntrophicum]|uniref:Uncharacterized protein n=1 Tax=Promethearchaeum syntrophicum TaxID=2594042 RepID=A0A5B9DDM8_9ARCH|nr:hypothetical protein [Candidatus Prometheoarchaeum syntrophicum]QEE17224.1 hypothetical protein DSAG12_03056 [Candidatus Prometheoarchaeum syntrophicum]
MPKFSKKKLEKLHHSKSDDLNYLFDKFSHALVRVEKKLDDLIYQKSMFGSNPQIEKEKQDCELLLEWIRNEFDEIKKSLFIVNKFGPVSQYS